MYWVIYLMETPLSLISYEPFKGLFSIMSGTQVQYRWTKTGKCLIVGNECFRQMKSFQ